VRWACQPPWPVTSLKVVSIRSRPLRVRC